MHKYDSQLLAFKYAISVTAVERWLHRLLLTVTDAFLAKEVTLLIFNVDGSQISDINSDFCFYVKLIEAYQTYMCIHFLLHADTAQSELPEIS